MRDFVSEKFINGRTFTLLRDSEEPWRNFIVCDGVEVEIPLPTWLNNEDIEDLF